MPLNPNRVFEAEGGFRVLDGTTEGPIYTGGPASPVGLDFPVGTFYVQNNGTGAVIWRKWNTGVNDWVKASPMDFYQIQSAVSESSTTSTTTYATKLTLTTPALPLGDYRLNWRMKWRAANANRGIQIQVLRNAAEVSNAIRFSASVSDFPIESNFLPLSGISGVQTFNLNFRVGIGSTTIFSSDSYMEIWRTA